MQYKIIEENNKKYVKCDSSEPFIKSEQDALDIISICWENDTTSVMLLEEVLTEDFFDLKTRLLGEILQKFVNYNIKVAIVLTSDKKLSERFGELISETNKRNDYRVLANMTEAENWLLI
jgi:Domain of unknown function (DUF4180)